MRIWKTGTAVSLTNRFSPSLSHRAFGNGLSRRFRLRQAQVRPAVEKILVAANDAAHGKGEYYTYDDVFGAAITRAKDNG